MKRQRTRIAQRLVLAGVLACAAGARGGEKVEIKGSTSIELPKPDRKIQEERRFKFDNSASELSGGYVPPQNIGTGPLDRKLREMLDKKKNWIFVNPYERKFDDRTAEILGDDKSPSSATPLMEHRLLQDEDKSAMQKFLEEKNTRRSSEPGSPDGRERDDGDFAQANRRDQFEEDPQTAEREEKKGALFMSERGGAPEMKAPSFDSAEFAKRMERTPLERSLFGDSRSQRPEIDTAELKRQQEAHDAEFEKFIQPRGLPSSAGGLAGRLDPLNTAADSTRQEPNPAAARRTDQFLSSPNRVNFGEGRSGGISASLPGSSFDFNQGARAAQGPSFLPSATPGPSAQTPSLGPAPFVFEFPRRKF